MATDSNEVVREHFVGGSSVCPFASSAPARYARDTESLEPLLAGLVTRTAAVIVADATPPSFPATRTWALETLMAAAAAATTVSYPSVIGPQRDAALAAVRSSLHDDASPMRPMIGLRGRALVTICMAPVYPLRRPGTRPPRCSSSFTSTTSMASSCPRCGGR